MNSARRVLHGVAVLAAAAIGMMGTQVARAVIAPVPLPALSNVLANDFAAGGNGQWASGPTTGYPAVTSSQLTDNDLGTLANSVAFNSDKDINVAILAVPANTIDYNNHGTPLGSTGTTIDIIRIYGQLTGDPGDTFTNGYNIPPTQVAVGYNYTGGDIENAYSIGWGSFTPATILAVNGVATGATAGQAVSLTGAVWQQNGAVSGTTGSGLSGIYYVDLTVNIPATNGLFFDIGESPIRDSAPIDNPQYGNGGMLVNEIQAGLVPEPASLGMLAIGGALILGRRRQA